jgi:hypothetical protein
MDPISAFAKNAGAPVRVKRAVQVPLKSSSAFATEAHKIPFPNEFFQHRPFYKRMSATGDLLTLSHRRLWVGQIHSLLAKYEFFDGPV